MQVIREMTDGGVDYSFECTGINDVLREAFLSTHDVSCAMPSLVRPSINNIARVHYMAQLDPDGPDHFLFLSPFFSTPAQKKSQGWGLTVVLGIHSTPKMVPLHPMELYGRRITGCVFGDFKGKSQLPDLVDKCVNGVRT